MCVVGSIPIYRTVSSELAVVERESVCRVFLTVSIQWLAFVAGGNYRCQW